MINKKTVGRHEAPAGSHLKPKSTASSAKKAEKPASPEKRAAKHATVTGRERERSVSSSSLEKPELDAPLTEETGHCEQPTETPAEKRRGRAEISRSNDVIELPPRKETRRERKLRQKREKEAAKARERQLKLEKKRLKREASRGLRKKLTVILTVLLVVALLILAALGYFGQKVTASETNLPNVCIGNVNVGGLTVEQTAAKLEQAGYNAHAETPFKVELTEDVTTELDFYEAGIVVSAEAVADKAYAYGHEQGITHWYSNLAKYLRGFVSRTEVSSAEAAVNSEYIYDRLDEAIARFDRLTEDGEYVIDEEKGEMRMLKGGGQLGIDRDALYETVVKAMKNGETGYVCPMSDEGIQMPDFDRIYNELNIEPIDAYYDAEKKEIVPSVDGFTFDLENAKKLWSSTPLLETVVIPVNAVEPELTTEMLEEKLFADILGKMTTGFASSNANRRNNLELACQKIDGIVLNPGEVFSYNETLGQRTEEAGFLPAGAYLDGEVVEEVGGGICQVSSTLYAATLYARLQIVSRTNHYFAVAYMDKGIDATVSWPNPDFKFANNTDYPIKIVAWYDPWDTQSLTVAIYGTAVDNYRVELWHETFSHSEDYTYEGVVYPDIGTAIVTCTYRSVYDENGNLLYTEPVNVNSSGDVYYDYYYLHKEDIIAKLPKLETPTTGGADVNIGGDTGGGDTGGGDTGGGDTGGGDTGGGDVGGGDTGGGDVGGGDVGGGDSGGDITFA